jgi:hypothetical protein
MCRSGAQWLVTTAGLYAQKLEIAVRPSAILETFLIGVPAREMPRARYFDVLAPLGDPIPPT